MNVSGHIRKRVNKENKSSYQITIELPVNSENGKRNRIYKTVCGTKKQAEKTMRTMMDELVYPFCRRRRRHKSICSSYIYYLIDIPIYKILEVFMIKLGTEKELFKIKHLPINIQTAISEDVRILDENYGKIRCIKFTIVYR